MECVPLYASNFNLLLHFYMCILSNNIERSNQKIWFQYDLPWYIFFFIRVNWKKKYVQTENDLQKCFLNKYQFKKKNSQSLFFWICSIKKYLVCNNLFRSNKKYPIILTVALSFFCFKLEFSMRIKIYSLHALASVDLWCL